MLRHAYLAALPLALLAVPSLADNIPINSLPALNSLPSAPVQIYLDFTGDTTATWTSGTTVYHPGTTAAYDTDSDPTTFSPQELDNIRQIWGRVAEKYSPFNINVTTVNPGTRPAKTATEVVIGGSYQTWEGQSAGGIADIGSFATNPDSKVFVFADTLSDNPHYIGEAATHESAHSLGLKHHSTYTKNGAVWLKTAEYSLGDGPADGTSPRISGSTAPILGNSYYADRGLWNNGPSNAGHTALQDDLAVITSTTNGITYRSHPNISRATATAITPTASADTLTFMAAGVIAQTTDQDFFSFTLPADAAIDIEILTAHYTTLDGTTVPINMLDAAATLYDSTGQVLLSAAHPAAAAPYSPDESLIANLAAGTYYVMVASQGNYGDLGQYTLTATALIPEPATVSLLALGALALFSRVSAKRGVRRR